MSLACNQCTATADVPTCTQSLVIGTVAAGDYAIYVQNRATGYIHKEEVTVGVDQQLVLDMTKPYPDFYTPNFYYTITVTEVDEPMNNWTAVTIGGELYDCFEVRFTPVYVDDETEVLTTYTLSV